MSKISNSAITFAQLLVSLHDDILSEAGIEVLVCSFDDEESYICNLKTANELKEKDKVVLLIGILPFVFVGERVVLNALRRLDKFCRIVDGCFLLNKETLSDSNGETDVTSLIEDEIYNIEQTLRYILKEGTLNISAETLREGLKDCGTFMVTRGEGCGNDRVEKAFKEAYTSPSFYKLDITTARKLFIKILVPTGQSLSIEEMNKLQYLFSTLPHTKDIILGIGERDTEPGDDKLEVLMLATGPDTIHYMDI